MPQFVSTTFSGADSGFAKISGQGVLRNYGDHLLNRKNFAKLLKFIGFEVSQIVDFSKPDEIIVLLSNSQPTIEDLNTCTLRTFGTTTFGGGTTGYAETSGRHY